MDCHLDILAVPQVFATGPLYEGLQQPTAFDIAACLIEHLFPRIGQLWQGIAVHIEAWGATGLGHGVSL
jgi:hypothetical protein